MKILAQIVQFNVNSEQKARQSFKEPGANVLTVPFCLLSTAMGLTRSLHFLNVSWSAVHLDVQNTSCRHPNLRPSYTHPCVSLSLILT